MVVQRRARLRGGVQGALLDLGAQRWVAVDELARDARVAGDRGDGRLASGGEQRAPRERGVLDLAVWAAGLVHRRRGHSSLLYALADGERTVEQLRAWLDEDDRL